MNGILKRSAPLMLLILTCCTKHGSDPGETPWQYPLEVGNKWILDSYMFAQLQDTSLEHAEFHDTVYVEITQFDTIPARTITAQMHIRLVEQGDEFHSWEWYRNLDTGLFHYAYCGSAGSAYPSPPPPSAMRCYRFKGMTFLHLHELSSYFTNPSFTSTSQTDSINFEDPPLRTLAYPVETGYEWDYRPAGEPFRIGKKIMNNLLVQTPAGKFNCTVIKWMYDLNQDGQWDTDIGGNDYIAEIGLVKREFFFIGVEGPEGNVSDTRDVMILRSFELH